ncbi:hypothetical protein N9M78_04515, partial [Alphaproteobacteria bacterium]|nr:hypothetical protein [Alphaproteobacteria bacterium]
PPEAMAGMDAGAWGDGGAASGSALDGMAPMGGDGMPPMGGDPMGDPFGGGTPMGGDPMGSDPMGGAPAFDGAMAAMDGAAAANMAEGMDAANTAADADAAGGAVDTPDNAPTDDVV